MRRCSNRRSQRGASLVEYTLLVSLIAVTAITSIRFVGKETKCLYGDIGERVGNANGGSGFVFHDSDCGGGGHGHLTPGDDIGIIDGGTGSYYGDSGSLE